MSFKIDCTKYIISNFLFIIILAVNANALTFVTSCGMIQEPGVYLVNEVIIAEAEDLNPNGSCLHITSSDVRLVGGAYVNGAPLYGFTNPGLEEAFTAVLVQATDGSQLSNIRIEDLFFAGYERGLSLTNTNGSRLFRLNCNYSGKQQHHSASNPYAPHYQKQCINVDSAANLNVSGINAGTMYSSVVFNNIIDSYLHNVKSPFILIDGLEDSEIISFTSPQINFYNGSNNYIRILTFDSPDFTFDYNAIRSGNYAGRYYAYHHGLQFMHGGDFSNNLMQDLNNYNPSGINLLNAETAKINLSEFSQFNNNEFERINFLGVKFTNRGASTNARYDANSFYGYLTSIKGVGTFPSPLNTESIDLRFYHTQLTGEGDCSDGSCIAIDVRNQPLSTKLTIQYDSYNNAPFNLPANGNYHLSGSIRTVQGGTISVLNLDDPMQSTTYINEYPHQINYPARSVTLIETHQDSRLINQKIDYNSFGVSEAIGPVGEPAILKDGLPCGDSCTVLALSRNAVSFIAHTPGTYSLTVAADTCAADFNGDGTLDVNDLFSFLAAWFVGDLSADMNNSGTLEVPDIFTYLSIWFEGCN